MLRAVCLKEVLLWLLKDDFPPKTFFLMLVESLCDDPQKVTPSRYSAPPDLTLRAQRWLGDRMGPRFYTNRKVCL